MTIKDNIMLAPVKLGILSKEEASQKADELLERIGLGDKAQAYPDAAFRRTETKNCYSEISCNESGCDIV